MDLQEIDRRLAIFAEELEILRHAQRLLARGFPFDANEIETRISRDEKKVSMLREMRPKACIRQAEKAAMGLILSIYRQGKDAKLGERLEGLGLWCHIEHIAEQIQEGENAVDAARQQQGGEEEGWLGLDAD